nr:MAG: capsid protein precursor [Mamastrovirus 3]
MSSWIVFGGEDQRQHLMANRQQKRIPRTTTNIVVRNGSAATQARAPGAATGKRRRRNRARKAPQVNVRVLANKNQARRRNTRSQGLGNRVVVQKIVSTLGTVGSNGSGQIETELAMLLNPSTMKETTGSNTFGPLQIYASTYSLYSIRSLKLHLKPLVGASAVSGTAVRISWNPTSNPTQTSWSALGARKHADTTPGKDARFTLSLRDLAGPKDGWYKTNTKGDPMFAFAGSLEIHTLGETRSTYQNQPFTGALFLAELEVLWAFKDYSQQPGLMNLIKGDSSGNATITTDGSGKLILNTPSTSTLARAASSTTASEIIWMVTDAVIQTTTAVFPPPFSWLLRGGWWFLKRIAGAPIRNGDEQFEVYASINDARAGVPCLTDVPNQRAIPIGQLHFQQITPGNTGIGSGIPSARAIDYPAQTRPTRCYVTAAAMLNKGTKDLVPATCIWYNRNYGQMHEKGAGFEVDNSKIATFNIYKVDVITDVGGINFDMFEHRVPIKLYGNSNSSVGWAVASSHSKVQDEHSVWVSSLLVYAAYPKEERYAGPWDISKVIYPGNNRAAQVTRARENGDVYIKFEQEGWYVLQYVVQGQVSGDYYVGNQIIATRATHNVTNIPTDYTFTPTLARANTGVFPVFSTGLHLTPFTSSTVTYVASRIGDTAEAAGQSTYSDLDPSFGCDDSMEFPPPPGEEELADDEEEFEDPEDDEDEELELGPDDDYSDPPISRLVVHPEAQQVYEQLRAQFPEREARLAANQLKPSGEYIQFTEMYHNALVDGLSPREARAFALGL